MFHDSTAAVKEFPVEEEYKKGNGITRQDVETFRQWLQTQPHLPAKYITDLDLILIYHCCERSSEVSKQVLDLHFTLRVHFPNFFKDRIVDKKILNTFNVVLGLPLEIRSSEGYAVYYARLLDYETKNFVFSEAIRAILMTLDLWQYEAGTWPGFVILIDMDRVTLGHLARLDIMTIRNFLYYLQKALLVKLKGLHFLNAPSFMDKLMMMLKPFLEPKLTEMLLIHQVGSQTLEKFVPIKGLPKEAGGEFKTLQECRDHILAKIEANSDYFLKENKKRVVESLRPGNPKSISDIFGGVEGSFKKLDID